MKKIHRDTNREEFMDSSFSEERCIFRVSLLTRGLMLGGGIMFLFFAVLSLKKEGPVMGPVFCGLFLLFALPSLAMFIGLSRSVFVTQGGIGTRWFGKEHFIRWENIGEARPKGDDSLALISADQMTTLKISMTVAAYGELVEIIRQMRPDLWHAGTIRVFHVGKWMIIFWLVIVAGTMVLTISSLLNSKNQFISVEALFLILLNALCLLITLRIPVSIHLNGDELVIKRVIGSMRIPRDAIQMVALGEIANINTVAMQGVTVWWQDARKKKVVTLQFSNVKEGSAALYASLYDWAGFAEREVKPGGGPF